MTRPAVPVASGVDHSELGPVLIGAGAIADRVKALAAEIDRDSHGLAFQMIVVMDGAWVFASDLARLIRGDVIVSFLKASSYGKRKISSGGVRVEGGSSIELQRDTVILVEDIVDSGETAQTLISLLNGAGAASIRLASLLSKPSRRRVDVPIDYLGFEVPNEFVVGYGMDYCGAFRHLPDIHVLRSAP